MRFFWLGCFLFTLLSNSSNGGILRQTLGEPEGPPVGESGFQLNKRSEPQPPSTHGINIKAPAPPPPGEGPQPPAAPDPYLLEIFEKSPETFPAAYIQWQEQQQQEQGQDNEREGRSANSKRITYDQFVTAAVVARLDLQRSVYTMFAPSDAYLNSLGVSLSAVALKDPECVGQIVRSHTVLGRVTLSDRMEDVAMSLEDSPVFICAKEANGVEVLRANIETDYGVVHIIDGLMDRPRLMDFCPSLRQRLSSPEGQQQQPVENVITNHSISLRKVSDQDLLASLQYDPSNEIDHNAFDVVVVPFPKETDPSPEANIPLELLVNIDNFAHAVKLTWQTEDNVIATLQSLGASTFLALLERSGLMDTLTRQGPWTVFAPDNEAWQALPKEIFDHIVSDPVLLRQILTYHVVQANATRVQLINDEKLPSLYDSRPIHINFYTDGWASWYTASGSQISDLDELASNGVVHVVKSVLLPPLGDFYSVVKWTPALQTAFSMLESVSNPAFTNNSVSLTAFLPVDSPVLDALLVGSSPSDVADILRRHVVRGTWFTSGLIDGDRLFTFDDQVLTVRRDADCVGINGACIAVRDITLTNGVLHVVDNLIL